MKIGDKVQNINIPDTPTIIGIAGDFLWLEFPMGGRGSYNKSAWSMVPSGFKKGSKIALDNSNATVIEDSPRVIGDNSGNKFCITDAWKVIPKIKWEVGDIGECFGATAEITQVDADGKILKLIQLTPTKHNESDSFYPFDWKRPEPKVGDYVRRFNSFSGTIKGTVTKIQDNRLWLADGCYYDLKASGEWIVCKAPRELIVGRWYKHYLDINLWGKMHPENYRGTNKHLGGFFESRCVNLPSAWLDISDAENDQLEAEYQFWKAGWKIGDHVYIGDDYKGKITRFHWCSKEKLPSADIQGPYGLIIRYHPMVWAHGDAPKKVALDIENKSGFVVFVEETSDMRSQAQNRINRVTVDFSKDGDTERLAKILYEIAGGTEWDYCEKQRFHREQAAKILEKWNKKEAFPIGTWVTFPHAKEPWVVVPKSEFKGTLLEGDVAIKNTKDGRVSWSMGGENLKLCFPIGTKIRCKSTSYDIHGTVVSMEEFIKNKGAAFTPMNPGGVCFKAPDGHYGWLNPIDCVINAFPIGSRVQLKGKPDTACTVVTWEEYSKNTVNNKDRNWYSGNPVFIKEDAGYYSWNPAAGLELVK